VEAQDAPGATAAVVTSQGAWAGAAGVDGVGSPLLPESAFAIASVTKTFVAAEVMLLAARGEVALDAAITDYVELPFDARGATVREVLAMESGFPQDPVGQLMRPTADPDRQWTVDEVLDLAIPGTHQGTRGGEPNYNNLNYFVLGALIEEVTGDPLAVALRRDLIEPADLDRVWVQPAEKPTPPLAVAASHPDAPAVDVDGPYLPSRGLASSAGAAGGIAADARTLARWGHLLYGGAVIDASLVQQMTAAEDDQDWYGLGTMLVGQGEDTVVGHQGDMGVYHSLLAVWPASATSVVVLVPSAAPVTLLEARTPLGLARTLHQLVAG
jgi:D-alanyl-D-alanine carboxypeptidase